MNNTCQYILLGELIEELNIQNSTLQYGSDAVRGVSNTKLIQKSKANMDGRDLSTFHVVGHNEFVFNRRTTRNGERLGLGFNMSNETYIFTEDYVHFKVRDENLLSPEFLYIFFLRDEFDRDVRYNSWGSATEFFNWEDMCRIDFPLPSIEAQHKAVNVWKALRNIKEQNEAIAEPLIQLCQSYLQEIKHGCKVTNLKEFIEYVDTRNDGSLTLDDVKGVSIEKKFIETKAKMDGVSLSAYKIVSSNDFCFVPVTSRNGEKITIAINDSKDKYLVSSAYEVFKVKDSTALNPFYLYLWFCKSEFDRYARFNSWGSARESFSYDAMTRVKIPIPSIESQNALVNIFKCAIEAKSIAEEADRRSREICPALIQYAIHN